MNWTNVTAPDLAAFERIADEAFAKLPEAFRRLCGNVPIRIEDFATDDVLRDLEIESPFDLLGLYSGRPLTHKSVMDAATQPDMVFLYRRPILDYWAEHDETLGDIITHVLIHEIGHHFGLSDADMEAIEASVT